jgi:hypothetical protein
MNPMTCPYCRETIEKPAPDRFLACPLCGYKSARVTTASEAYLVIDSKLPDLMDKFREILRFELDSTILIDRRIGQLSIAGTERRR